MSAIYNTLDGLRAADNALHRHEVALSVQIGAQCRHLDVWPDDDSDARHDAVEMLRERRTEAATIRQMRRDLGSLILRAEALCVQMEEPV